MLPVLNIARESNIYLSQIMPNHPFTIIVIVKCHTNNQYFVGAINTTAHNIQVKPFEAPPPPTLRDHMNPAVGKYMYDTGNMFQQERLTGTCNTVEIIVNLCSKVFLLVMHIFLSMLNVVTLRR